MAAIIPLLLCLGIKKHLSLVVFLSRDLLGTAKHNESSAYTSEVVPRDAKHPVIIASIHQGYGTHYINFYCGSPPQHQRLIIDTGSDVTGFVCQGCRKCGNQHHNVFDFQASTTYRELNCENCLRGKCTSKPLRNLPGKCVMEASYREGSGWTAKEVTDICHIGDWHKHLTASQERTPKATTDDDTADNFQAPARFPLKFACQTSISGAFQSQLEDGIVGFERGKGALWQQLYSSGAVRERGFAMCFGRPRKASVSSSPNGSQPAAGILTIGGVDPRLHKSTMVHSQGRDKSSKSTYFSVLVRKVHLQQGAGGNSALSSNPDLLVMALNISEADLNQEEIIVDSGATDSYFTKRLEAPFQQAYKQLTGRLFDKAKEVSLTREELESLPTMLFQLRGVVDVNEALAVGSNYSAVGSLAGDLDPDHPFDVIVAFPPSHYYEYDAESGRYLSRFHFDPHYDSALGSSAMLGHNIYFDVDNNRIGWAESSCDYDALIAQSFDSGRTGEGAGTLRVDDDDESDGVEAGEDLIGKAQTLIRPEGGEESPNEQARVSSVAMPALSEGQEDKKVHDETTDEPTLKSPFETKPTVSLPQLRPFIPDAGSQQLEVAPSSGLCPTFKCQALVSSMLLLISVAVLRRLYSLWSRGRGDGQYHALKATTSDDEDDPYPTTTSRGSPSNRSFDGNELDNKDPERIVSQSQKVTRRHRG
jgi:hypothetical protein